MSLDTRWLISAGDLGEWLRPALFAAAALLSAVVLADALRRGFRLYHAAAWSLAALLLPQVALPLYLAALLLFARGRSNEDATPQTKHQNATTTHDDEPRAAASTEPAFHQQAKPRAWRRALPLAYLLALLSFGALRFYTDYNSSDAHLARAANAKLRNQRERAVAEYRAALALSDDPHTRKLLGVELAEQGRSEEALSELRAAERGGEPDERLPFHIARALDALNRPAEAVVEYRRFLDGTLCARHQGLDPLCERARERLFILRGGY